MTLLLTLDDGSVQRKLADAVEFARVAVLAEAPEEQIGAHVGAGREDAVSASHLFEAQVPGYRGWRWCVTIALAGDDEPVTVSEVVLVPGPEARIAPAWVPWERRVRAGDLGVGDIFPTDENDPRLAPAYLQSDDPAVEEVARETGLGRIHVLSRFGREDAATRWHDGEFGPRSDMARSAPGVCGTCGFFVPLAGSLRGGFGACTNDIAPADGHVVDVEYGCGAHSEVEVEVTSSIPVAELVYDDSLLEFDTPAAAGSSEAPVAPVVSAPADRAEGTVADPTVAEVEAVAVVEATEVVESPAAEPETAVTEADLSPAEVELEVAEAEAAAAAATQPVTAEAEPVVVEPVAAEAESVEPVTAGTESAAAEPVVAEAVPEAEVSEPIQAEATAEPQSVVPEAEAPEAEAPEAAVTDAVAETQVAEAEGVAVDEQPVVAAGPEAPVAEQAEVSEPVHAVEPQAVVPEVEPAVAAGSEAEAASGQEPARVDVAELPDATPEAQETAVGETGAADVPESAQADVAAEPQVAEADDAAVAELSVVVGEPVAAEAEVTDTAVGPMADGSGVELPEAVLTDSVVTETAEPQKAQPAQAEVTYAVVVEPTQAEGAEAGSAGTEAAADATETEAAHHDGTETDHRSER
ncbi:DUF3027 domain-containing protein [Amycolatopsis sp. cmx-8-4]|uniref:DUF3027 domain-containing protein n=1 Tax=Amycolatopsis sp. cmx-8-4 TaxID=2790947 RepID=UPI00397A05A9